MNNKQESKKDLRSEVSNILTYIMMYGLWGASMYGLMKLMTIDGDWESNVTNNIFFFTMFVSSLATYAVTQKIIKEDK